MSFFQISIQGVLLSILRDFDIKKLDAKYVNTAIFYFKQLESLEFFTKKQRKEWAEALSDAYLRTKEKGFGPDQISLLNTYLDILAKKVQKILPYYQSYAKIMISLQSICELRHHMGVSSSDYERYKEILKTSINPSDEAVKEMVELERFIENRLVQTRELGAYVALSRKFTGLLSNTSTVLTRLGKEHKSLEELRTLFDSVYYDHLYFIPADQQNVMRDSYNELLSAYSLLIRVEKNRENSNAQGQLMDIMAMLRRMPEHIEKHVNALKAANSKIGFGDYHDDNAKVIPINNIIGFKRVA